MNNSDVKHYIKKCDENSQPDLFHEYSINSKEFFFLLFGGATAWVSEALRASTSILFFFLTFFTSLRATHVTFNRQLRNLRNGACFSGMSFLLSMTTN
jgi:hypothetical protein